MGRRKKYICSYCGKKFKDSEGVTIFEGDFCPRCREQFPEFNARKEEEVKTIAIDLDGTLLKHWEGTFDTHKFGEVLPGAKEALKEMKELGYFLIIHTCRTDEEAVAKYLKEKKIPFDAININPNAPEFDKKPVADIYIDDRAINFSGNWRKALYQIKEFETWEQKIGMLPEDLSTAAFIKDQDERVCGICKRQVEDPELVSIKMEIPGVINLLALGFYCCSQCQVNLEAANSRISRAQVSLPLKIGKAVSEHVKQLLALLAETQ